MPAMRLNSLMRLFNAEKIDILKLDVEGEEIPIFNQLLEMSDSKLPTLIYADMDSMGKSNCGGTEMECEQKRRDAQEIVSRLQKRGYNITKLRAPSMAFFKPE